MNEPSKDRIDDFLLDRMSLEEKNAFEAALERDADLRKAVDAQSKLIHGMAAFGRRQLKAELQDIHQELYAAPQQPRIRSASRSWAAIAATIALLLAAGLWWFWPSPSPQQWYADYYQAYELQWSQRSQTDKTLAQIAQLYQDKAYAAALPRFQALLAEQPNQPQLQIAAGICLLELNQPQAALPYFEAIRQSNDLLLKDQATWYAALAHLKLEDLPRTRSLLQSLTTDPSADHHTEAQTLLKKLN